MGFTEILASYINSPARIYTSIRDTVLPSPSARKRRREDSTNAQVLDLEPTASRPRTSEHRQNAAYKSTAEAQILNAVASAVPPLPRIVQNGLQQLTTPSEPQQRPERWQHQSQTPKLLAAYEAGRYGTKRPAHSDLPADRPFARAQTPQLYRSVVPHRRHGPYSSFCNSDNQNHFQPATPQLVCLPSTPLADSAQTHSSGLALRPLCLDETACD